QVRRFECSADVALLRLLTSLVFCFLRHSVFLSFFSSHSPAGTRFTSHVWLLFANSAAVAGIAPTTESNLSFRRSSVRGALLSRKVHTAILQPCGEVVNPRGCLTITVPESLNGISVGIFGY